jgi:inosine/xanthosine triphosphatase
MIKIKVGTLNPVKLTAVREALQLYPKLFPALELSGMDINSGKFGHPKNIEETVAGAIARAKAAFQECDYSIGLEGGLIEVPHSFSGYMETSVCAIYDGKQFYLGLGPAFEWPKQVTAKILKGEADASMAFKQLGLTKEEKLGAVSGGINGFLTAGRLPREESLKDSVIMAMIYLERPELN